MNLPWISLNFFIIKEVPSFSFGLSYIGIIFFKMTSMVQFHGSRNDFYRETFFWAHIFLHLFRIKHVQNSKTHINEEVHIVYLSHFPPPFQRPQKQAGKHPSIVLCKRPFSSHELLLFTLKSQLGNWLCSALLCSAIYRYAWQRREPLCKMMFDFDGERVGHKN